ncbi:hypothetical protein RD792_008681 [Penstemon davidsonii]|uniref:NAC domain-containing protein n=1 Tax=Penstemon davidsonii TaxID=160366 RepID=A0ABR0D9T1_9LAMI|nr:hypothetical protein RD792_008681 [Penstemon davidsonii]
MEYVKVFPPGYRFHPTDDELIIHYLKKKTMNEPIPCNKIPEVNIYKYNPQQLSEKFPPLEENIWYFFTPRDRKFQSSVRVNRVACTGNWKATAKDKPVCYNGEIVGSKKVLVFYEGKSKTNWIMYEYTVKENNLKRKNTNNMRMDDWVLCRIYNRDDKSSRNQRQQNVVNVPIENYVASQFVFPQSMDRNNIQLNNDNNFQPSPHQSIDIGQSNGITNNCEDDRVLPPSEYFVMTEDPHSLMSDFQFSVDDYLLPNPHCVEENPANIYLNEESLQETDQDPIKTTYNVTLNSDIEAANSCDLSGFEDFCMGLETMLTSNELDLDS